jgi:hypothetical protein
MYEEEVAGMAYGMARIPLIVPVSYLLKVSLCNQVQEPGAYPNSTPPKATNNPMIICIQLSPELKLGSADALQQARTFPVRPQASSKPNPSWSY